MTENNNSIEENENINFKVYRGHYDLVNIKRLHETKVVMLGAGSIGSFAAIAMAKMGIKICKIIDFDNVEIHNQANQIYNWQEEGKEKVTCLNEYISKYAQEDWQWEFINKKLNTSEDYKNEFKESNVVISAVDNMTARQMLFEYIKNPINNVELFIDSRIGATQTECFAIRPDSLEELDLFESNHLDNDEDMPDIKCTEKSIIFPVTWTASWITSCLYHLVNDTLENVPFCIDLNFKDWSIFKDPRPKE